MEHFGMLLSCQTLSWHDLYSVDWAVMCLEHQNHHSFDSELSNFLEAVDSSPTYLYFKQSSRALEQNNSLGPAELA